MPALSISRAAPALQRFGTRRLALAVAYCLIFAIAIRIPDDPDTFWHLRSGEQTLASGIIRADSFSYTRADERWQNHSWGGQLLLLASWRLASAPGPALLTAALATLGMAIVGRMMAESRANAHLRAYLLALAALTATVFWTARPQMFSFVLCALTLWLYRRGGLARWWLPPLFALWANLHAGFVIGLLWLALAGAADGWQARMRRPARANRRPYAFLLLLAACALALCLNPYGPSLLLAPLRTLSLSELASIAEWQTPNLRLPANWPFLLMLALTLLAPAVSRRRPRAEEAALIALTAMMALLAGRNIALFALVAAPTLAAQWAELPLPPRWRLPQPPPTSARRGAIHAVLLLALAIGVALYAADTLAPARIEAALARRYPAAAVRFLQESQPPGPLFHAYEWGGYLLRELPEYPVFIDGRTLLYGDELLFAYRQAASGADWQALFAEYEIRLVLMPRGSGLERALRRQPLAWQLLHLDETAALYARRAG